jgi:hypothetical protein
MHIMYVLRTHIEVCFLNPQIQENEPIAYIAIGREINNYHTYGHPIDHYHNYG